MKFQLMAFFLRVPSSGKKRKRKNVDEYEADYEKRPRKASVEQGHNERTLLPIKSKDSIIQRKEKLPLTGTCTGGQIYRTCTAVHVFTCACTCNSTCHL